MGEDDVGRVGGLEPEEDLWETSNYRPRFVMTIMSIIMDAQELTGRLSAALHFYSCDKEGSP